MYNLDGLPREIIDIILSYEGTFKSRNGKYMIQLRPSDPRYTLLGHLPVRHELAFGRHFDVIIYFRKSLFMMYIGSGYDNDSGVENDEIRYVFTRRNVPILSNECYVRT